MTTPRPNVRRHHLAAVDGESTPAVSFADVVATCSKVLLRSNELEEIDEALQALLEVTDATSIFVEVNVDDPELGPCSTLVREVAVSGIQVDEERWRRIPWSQMPTSYAALSQGRSIGFHLDDLDEVERSLYDGSENLSELDVPFFSSGSWAGLIGLSDRSDRQWSEREVQMLSTVADMLGAFWERREARAALTDSMIALETRLRYEEALAACSRDLLASAEEEASLESTLQRLLTLTPASFAFVERNVEVPEKGLCSRLIEFAHRDARPEGLTEYWESVPWSQMPDAYAHLSRGEWFAFTPADLGPVERQVYHNAPFPLASEIDIPIMVEGRWEGLLGFADTETVVSWGPEEVMMLQTAADMIGSSWARARRQRELGELLESKDRFIAAVSHELRTPLTSVVGLSVELRDHLDRFGPGEVSEYLTILADQSTEMSGIVDDLLVAARMQSEGIRIVPSLLDAASEVRAVLAGLSAAAIEITGSAVVWADATRFRQIVRNLVTNAQRYGGPDIRVEIVGSFDRCVVRVVDDGDGVPDDSVDAVFEPYTALHLATTQPDSIGLGLTVARRLSELMEGDLRYSREGDLTVFSLGLPRRPRRGT